MSNNMRGRGERVMEGEKERDGDKQPKIRQWRNKKMGCDDK